MAEAWLRTCSVGRGSSAWIPPHGIAVRATPHRARMLPRCCQPRLFAVLPDHRPRPPRDRGNLAGVTRGKSPLQVIDQPIENLQLLFFDARHAPKTTGLFDVATRFRDGDRPLVFVDPLVNVSAALYEQTLKVFGLAVIRRLSGRGDALIDSRSRPAHAHRRHGLAVTDVDRPRIRQPSIAPIRVRGGVRVACETLVRQSGEGHLISLNRRFDTKRGQQYTLDTDGRHMRPR
jgi:hypothetical protein